MKIEDLINLEPYLKKKNYNNYYFFNLIKKISLLHSSKCKSYKKILDHLKFNITKIQELKNLPFIPASVFKDFDLKSISDEKTAKLRQTNANTINKQTNTRAHDTDNTGNAENGNIDSTG